MPELPEVATVCQQLQQSLIGDAIVAVQSYVPALRYPLTEALKGLRGRVLSVERRSKVIIVHMAQGALLIHLGMSGKLRLQSTAERIKHDHIVMTLSSARCLIYHDPRRFGFVDYCQDRQDLWQHRLLSGLGIEPLAIDFDGQYLYQLAQGRRCAIKTLLMNGKLIVGIGNIYAQEALFRAGVHPGCPASALTLDHCERLVSAAKAVLKQAIAQGGTTFSDFQSLDGSGYFQIDLDVYGRAGKPCKTCQSTLQQMVISGRSTVFCDQCQSLS